MRQLRVYADTSVFGGCFDAEFEGASKAFFREVAEGRYRLLISQVTVRELNGAPEAVQQVLAHLPAEMVEQIPGSEEVEKLRDAYLRAGVVGPASAEDAEHIAAASVADADLLISWNFRHIVHLDKILGYEAVNLTEGYKALRILSPREVISE